MFKRYKALTREYMQKYKAKRGVKIPRIEKKIRKCLIRNINKEIKSGIKYGRMDVFLDLSKQNILSNSLERKADNNCYKRVLLEVINEYRSNGIKVNKRVYVNTYNFNLEGVFDNDSQKYDI